jgi:rhamnosyltransferase
MSITVVIRAFNEEKHIGRLLYGISQQTCPNPEVILVDSGSTDETLAIAAQYSVKILHIQPEDFTFGRSLNTGIAAASGDLVVIISAHCYPIYPDWLEKLTQPFINQNVALSYGKQRGGETNYYAEHQFFRKYFPDNSVLQQSHSYSHNANAAIRRKLWEIQPYDENLTGLEDLAWSSWAMESGYEIAYVAEAEVIHEHNETMKQVYKRYMRESIALKSILPNSKFSFFHFLRQWLVSTLSDLIHARRDQELGKYAGQVILFRLMQYWGTFKGYQFAGKIDTKLHQAFYYPPNALDEKKSKPRMINHIDYNDE